jgi:hypothetical protein
VALGGRTAATPSNTPRAEERLIVGSKTKKVILFIVLAFFVYAVFTSPTKAADIVGNLWGVIVDGFNSILAFFNSLLNR